ncbi:MAG: Pantoate kinase [Methanoregula sp. PtaU1.Bin051]|nr:MAG: Pantoate kinase [Methanoregula sp. PtaU1.Bin051]
MSRRVAAFCPGHISGYFKRVDGPDAATTGSVGAGLVISEGVLACVTPAERTDITVWQTDHSRNRVRIAGDSPPIRYAMKKLSVDASVMTECRLPVGAGFGLSAAALLATITALNQLYDIGMDERRIAHLAHETEIVHRTGLGDVTSCRGGGMVVRTVAGIDAPVRRIHGLSGPVSAVSFGPINTPSVLGSPGQMEKVAAAFPSGEPKTIEDFFSYSRAFTEKSGLITPQVREVLDFCDHNGINASMTMLGNGVFAYGDDAEPILSRFSSVHSMAVAKNGPVLLKEEP